MGRGWLGCLHQHSICASIFQFSYLLTDRVQYYCTQGRCEEANADGNMSKTTIRKLLVEFQFSEWDWAAQILRWCRHRLRCHCFVRPWTLYTLYMDKHMLAGVGCSFVTEMRYHKWKTVESISIFTLFAVRLTSISECRCAQAHSLTVNRIFTANTLCVP